MTSAVDNHPAVALSPREQKLIEAGANMDNMAAQYDEMVAEWGPEDEDSLKLSRLLEAATDAFTHAHTMVVRERRALGLSLDGL